MVRKNNSKSGSKKKRAKKRHRPLEEKRQSGPLKAAAEESSHIGGGALQSIRTGVKRAVGTDESQLKKEVSNTPIWIIAAVVGVMFFLFWYFLPG